MPVNVVKTKADEKKWNRAEARVHKQYGSVKKHYGAVMHIFQNMKKSGNPRRTGAAHRKVSRDKKSRVRRSRK